jgi:hypothetical protein
VIGSLGIGRLYLESFKYYRERKRERHMKQLRQIPTFKNEAEEADFWATHDTTECSMSVAGKNTFERES